MGISKLNCIIFYNLLIWLILISVLNYHLPCYKNIERFGNY